jgi:sugar diacid utilization regulator
MASELQRLVDYLGTRLGRSVAIDDPHIRLLAYNPHNGEVDNMRTEAVMRRSVPDAMTSHVSAHGAAQAEDLFTIPACPELGMTLERIGMPIRYEGALLGYLWLLGSEGQVSDAHADTVREAARQAALILHREYLAGEVSRSRERELVRDLLSPDSTLRAEAAGALIEEDLIVAGPVCALVLTLPHELREPLGERERLALHLAAGHGRSRLPPAHALSLSRPDHALLLTVWPGTRSAAIDKNTGELARVMRERLITELGQGTDLCWIGIGGTHQHLAEALGSYREARDAADVARITGALGQIVPYSRLGVYALLAKLPTGELADGIHPGLRPLLAATGRYHELVETLRAYLDNAGDVQRTAAHLHIHRATLYHRLRRIEELSTLDLSRGDDRLAAHLSLKLARLTRSGLPASSRSGGKESSDRCSGPGGDLCTSVQRHRDSRTVTVGHSRLLPGEDDSDGGLLDRRRAHRGRDWSRTGRRPRGTCRGWPDHRSRPCAHRSTDARRDRLTLTPGLIDAHVHLGLSSDIGPSVRRETVSGRAGSRHV